MSESIQLSIEGAVATITIAREERRNSLDHVAMAMLEQALQECQRNGAGAIVLTGQGIQSFCAGDDVKAYAERTAEESNAHFERGLRTFDLFESHPCLTIAAIEGFCLGGGLELALCCDLRFAGRGAQFGLPEIPRLGFMPSWGGLTRLPRAIGLARAKQMAFTGERIDGEEAARIGLVARLADDGSALTEAKAFAAGYVEKASREITAVAKAVMNDAGRIPSSAASLVNLLAERSHKFEGA